MNLLSLVLTLQPVESIPATPEKPLPQWWGRAVHALLLDAIRQQNDVLAAELHDAEGVRPFTVSTLMGPSTRNGLDAEAQYFIRMTAFRQDVAETLWQATQPGGALAVSRLVELDYIGFQVVAADGGQRMGQRMKNGLADGATDGAADERIETAGGHHPWAAQTTYQALSAPYLLAKVPAPRRITMRFTSPITFKSRGMHVPIPLPVLLFGSLLKRWNAFAPVVFPPETRRYAEECLAISRYKLQSRAVPMKSSGLRMGGIGEVTYTTLNYDRYWMSVIQTLARFAQFSGAGAGTTVGLGQCRVKDS